MARKRAGLSLVEAGILLLASPDSESVAKGLVRIAVEQAGAEEVGIWAGEPFESWHRVVASPDDTRLPSELPTGHAWRAGAPAAPWQSIRIGDRGVMLVRAPSPIRGVSFRFLQAACSGLHQRWMNERPGIGRDLQTSVLRLEAIIRRTSSSLLVEDEHRRIALVNQQFCNLFAIPAPPEVLVGADCSDAAEQSKHLFADPRTFVDRISDILARRETVLSEELEMADGRILERDYIPLFIDGVYSGHLWLYRDVSEARRETARTDDLRRFYEQVLEAMPAQLAVFDDQLRYQYLTPSAVKDPVVRASMIGLTDAEYCEMRGIDPAVGALRMERIARVRDTLESETFEESFQTPTGGYRHFVRYVSPVVVNGKVSHILGYGLDVSDRREAADRLRRNEAISRAVAHASFDAVITADSAGKIIEFSRAAERMFGIASEKAIGQSLAEVVVPHALRDAHLAGMARYNSTGEARVLGQLLELPALRMDGTTFEAEVFIEAITLRDGEKLFTAFIRDVSERKRVEKDLVAAREAAEGATRATERFLATMSHEMRTPLNAVLGLTHLLLDTRLDDPQRDYLSAIRFSADHLRLLINDVLDVAKIQSGHLRIDHQPFRLRQQLSEVIRTTSIRANEKMLSLDLEVDSGVPDTLAGDPVRLAQILVNLIGNAVKFTSEGGVNVRVASAGDGPGDGRCSVLFEVADTGIGIAPEEQEQIFSPFVQSDDPRAREAGGTGLGLHIVRELATLLGGTISLKCEPGKGSRFTVELPFDVVDEASIGGSFRADPVGAPLRGSRILLVEDNELNQAVATGLLRRWGADVTIAENGLRAVEQMGIGRFDMILMDIQMPVMDGFEATRQIRSGFGEVGRSIPIIALTASVLLDHRSELVVAGLDDFVLKPFDPPHLLDRIRTWLNPNRGADGGSGMGSVLDSESDPAAAGEPPVSPPEPRVSSPEPPVSPPEPLESPGVGSAGFEDPVASSIGIGLVDKEILHRNTLGKPAFLRRLVGLFREHTPSALDSMRDAAARGDLDSIRASAHSMKSSAGMLGITSMQDRLANLESAARGQDIAACGPEAVEAISNMYLGALEELESIVMQTSSEQP